MWEGDVVLDCLEDRRITLEASCCPCYRFGKNMRRANLGSCFLQVMEEAALIDHVRSLFGQLGSSTAVVPHDPFLQDPIMKTIVCNSLDVPNSSHLIDLPGSVNTSSPNDDRISHHFRHQMSPASMIQPFHSVQQFYAGATFCCPVTRASCCDFFQPLVQSDHTSTFLLNSQSEGNKSTAKGSI